MNKLLLVVISLTIMTPAMAQQYYNPYKQQQAQQQPRVYIPQPIQTYGPVHVGGYTNNYGTYVQPYTRSYPDGNPFNNKRSYNNQMPTY